MVPIAVLLAPLSRSSARRMLNVATIKGAMLASALLGKTKQGMLVSMTQTALTTKSVKMQSALLVGTRRGFQPTELSQNHAFGRSTNKPSAPDLHAKHFQTLSVLDSNVFFVSRVNC